MALRCAARCPEVDAASRATTGANRRRSWWSRRWCAALRSSSWCSAPRAPTARCCRAKCSSAASVRCDARIRRRIVPSSRSKRGMSTKRVLCSICARSRTEIPPGPIVHEHVTQHAQLPPRKRQEMAKERSPRSQARRPKSTADTSGPNASSRSAWAPAATTTAAPAPLMARPPLPSSPA